ncbi:MAG: hypothetical protein AAFZ63_08820 [Bacteroidota bacterium]
MEAFERLEQLLLSGEFSQLSDHDQAWLAEQGINGEAFESQREVLLLSQQLFDAPRSTTSSLNTQGQLQQKLDQLRRQRHLRWYRSAAAVLLFATGLLIGRSLFAPTAVPPTVKEEERLVQPPAPIIDTVYLEHPVEPELKVIYRERVVHDTIYLPAVDGLPVAEVNTELLPVTSPDTGTNFSRNAKETEALLKVLVEVY